ncbi:Agenet domain containing protein [Parasponia andersonii]|uniref:Agenet domain containing protein n=1 Tax=Parasponia andersonii TaxID=3476 RepID=A0A2P5B3V1_PARAD|nr:Agenet domain containing protein [Parasponia andersonii]
MSGNGHCFVEWKEQFVSQERGNRVVHYFLKDSAGESILAVVGTERSVRHMFYVIADEFLQVYGKESSIHAGFKWRSRREVVDWLTSMLSKQHLHGDRSESLPDDSAQALGFPEYPINGISAQHTQAPDDKGRFAKSFRVCNSDIVWSGSPWKCGKQLKHYPAFRRNGITVTIQSFVFVMAKGENHYLAYLEDMYEDKRGQKKVKVRWFHHNQEVKGVIPLRNPHPKEVFITPYAQVISAECVDGLATVLTREHYEKCTATIPHAFLAKVHMCYRQFKSNRTKPFDLSKLRGYFDQPILSCLGPDFFLQPESWEEDDEIGNGDVKLGAKRTRSGNDHSRAKNTSKNRLMMTYGPYQNLSYGSSGRGLFSLKHFRSQPWLTQLFKVDDKIELLCQDSGIRGCWFRCTVLQVSKKQMKVQYDDLQDEDGSGNLEEWIPSFKLALPDKLGMRHSGRPTIRPAPTKEQTDLSLEVGAAIDAWWSDGWWEGVVTGIGSCSDDVQIFFPGESLVLSIHKKDLRVSRDWLGDQWINIEAKPDVISAISVLSRSGTKPSMSSTVGKNIKSGGLPSSFEDPASTKNVVTEEENQNLNLIASTSSDDPPKDMDWANCEKSPSLIDHVNEDDGVDADDSCDNVDSFKGNDDDDKDEKENNNDNNDDGGKVDMKELETSGQSCKAVEMMEVTA